jgi:hypothetical protein
MLCGKYEMEWVANVVHGIPPFVYVTKTMLQHQHVGATLDDLDVVALSIPPCTIAISYNKIKAYMNHFHVDNVTSINTMSYDMGGIIFQP